nr:MAG TPA: hypothetical protein [Caudoviricetes sp.]
MVTNRGYITLLNQRRDSLKAISRWYMWYNGVYHTAHGWL